MDFALDIDADETDDALLFARAAPVDRPEFDRARRIVARTGQ
jgi:hypothetical protein